MPANFSLRSWTNFDINVINFSSASPLIVIMSQWVSWIQVFNCVKCQKFHTSSQTMSYLCHGFVFIFVFVTVFKSVMSSHVSTSFWSIQGHKSPESLFITLNYKCLIINLIKRLKGECLAFFFFFFLKTFLNFFVTMLVKFGAVNALQWCGKGGLEQGLGTSFASQVATCPPTTCPSTNNKKIRHKPLKIVMGTMFRLNYLLTKIGQKISLVTFDFWQNLFVYICRLGKQGSLHFLRPSNTQRRLCDFHHPDFHPPRHSPPPM